MLWIKALVAVTAVQDEEKVWRMEGKKREGRKKRSVKQREGEKKESNNPSVIALVIQRLNKK